jgi:predicted RecA/RadA family phage recombinase
MGQLKTDGRATQGGITWPAGIITFGDLYRVGGLTGVALNNVAAADAGQARKGDMEIAPDRIWYVKVPSGLTAAKGDYLAWGTAATATFQRGDTDLVAFVAATHKFPCAVVEETKDANNYAAVRILNVGPSGA